MAAIVFRILRLGERAMPSKSFTSLLQLSTGAASSSFLSPCRLLHTSLPRQELIPLDLRPDIAAIKHDVKRGQFKSGDKEALPKPAYLRLRPGFENCRELEDAHPDVRRMCSMEFAGYREPRALLEMDLTRKVQRFGSDFDSIEVRIARLTAQIRTYQAYLATLRNRSKGKPTQILLEAVNRRKKYLRRLRAWDYNKFCWVLEQLNLEFESLEYAARTTRRNIARGLIQKEAMEIRRDKFIKYHQELKAKQRPFLIRKETELAAIDEEEKTLQVELEMLKESDPLKHEGIHLAASIARA